MCTTSLIASWQLCIHPLPEDKWPNMSRYVQLSYNIMFDTQHILIRSTGGQGTNFFSRLKSPECSVATPHLSRDNISSSTFHQAVAAALSTHALSITHSWTQAKSLSVVKNVGYHYQKEKWAEDAGIQLENTIISNRLYWDWNTGLA